MNTAGPAHGAVVLAAGASRRLGRSKQLLRRNGEALVHRAARLALSTQPLDALVVLGADAGRVGAAVADLPIRRLECADWQRGIGASLRAGIDALAQDCAGVLIVVCDQPALDAEHLERILCAWQLRPEQAAASAYAGRIGVPALLPRSWRAGLDEDERGAAALLERRAEHVQAIANPALVWDVDAPDDLDAAFDEE